MPARTKERLVKSMRMTAAENAMGNRMQVRQFRVCILPFGRGSPSRRAFFISIWRFRRLKNTRASAPSRAAT